MPDTKPPVPHYTSGAIQPIDFIEASFTPIEYQGFLRGQVVKYISRFPHKGTPLDDLRKARVYLDWLIEHVEKHHHAPEDKTP